MDATCIKTGCRGNGLVAAIAPLVMLPTFAFLLMTHLSAWQFMWLLAMSIYAGLKWLTFATSTASRHASTRRCLGYLVLWPGMNVNAFFDVRLHGQRPTIYEGVQAIFKLAVGVVLLSFIAPHLMGAEPLVAGWVGMIGLAFFLHFGLFHILSICWRLHGIDAEPIMDFPILASSLSDFWGRRWNRAFRDLAFGLVFRQLVRPLGVAAATTVVFAVSGVIHELVISVPAGGGWGGPTLYFVIQGAGLLLEHSQVGKCLRLDQGVTGRVFCAVCTVGPICLLFHEPFICRVILPMLAVIG